MKSFLLFFNIFLASQVFGQTKSRRDIFFDDLEKRAQNLSLRLAEIGGTDPLVFERPESTKETYQSYNSEKYSPTPQQQFDNLPDNSGLSEESDSSLNATDPSIELINEENNLPKVTRYMESHLGKYFIQPFIGAVFPAKNISVSGSNLGSPNKIEVDNLGHSIGLDTGIRWGNLETSLSLAYSSFGYDRLITVAGNANGGGFEILDLNFRLGYGIPITESFWIKGAAGIGMGRREDHLNFNSPLYTITIYNKDTVLSHDFLLRMGFSLEIGLDGFWGYRYMKASDNGDFDHVAMHMLELGLGANF